MAALLWCFTLKSAVLIQGDGPLCGVIRLVKCTQTKAAGCHLKPCMAGIAHDLGLNGVSNDTFGRVCHQE
jgi:hypothetical protein